MPSCSCDFLIFFSPLTFSLHRFLSPPSSLSLVHFLLYRHIVMKVEMICLFCSCILTVLAPQLSLPIFSNSGQMISFVVDERESRLRYLLVEVMVSFPDITPKTFMQLFSSPLFLISGSHRACNELLSSEERHLFIWQVSPPPPGEINVVVLFVS